MNETPTSNILPVKKDDPALLTEPLETLIPRLVTAGEPLADVHVIWHFFDILNRVNARLLLEKARYGGSDLEKREVHLQEEERTLRALMNLLGTRLSRGSA